jgi:hypothetical protein
MESPDAVPQQTAAHPAFAPTRAHARRLREVYRSAGWPCQDLVEVELLAAGLLQRVTAASGHETLRVTDAGIRLIAASLQTNRAARSAHEALVDTVAREMTRAGRLAWTGLTLRAWVADPGAPLPDDARPAPPEPADAPAPLDPVAPPHPPVGQWVLAMPDVFSIRRTTVEAYLHPVVHEIKVRRADLLGDLKKPAKRAAYLDMGGECWYVLGTDARGRPIGQADDIPPECGVMLAAGGVLTVARPAPRRPVERLPLAVWMALAQSTPCRFDDGAQAPLTPCDAP